MTVNEATADRIARVVAAVAAASAASVLYTRWIRRRLLTWGASQAEITRAWPGDELIPDVNTRDFTMATTLPAPPEQVWPWLVQMGVGRASWYSWDRLDNGGKPSADRIVSEWQSLEVGQRLNVSPDGQKWMTVAVVEPNQTLVLRATAQLPSGRSFDPRSAPFPRVYLDGILGLHLRPTPGGQTRLVAHTHGRNRPQLLMGAFSLLLAEPSHFIMQTRQFHGLRTRVGAQA